MEELDLPFQTTGADFMARRDRGGCWDDPGCGKSRQAIKAADNLLLKRGVVICPAGGRQVWPGEFKKFGRYPRRVIKATDKTDLHLWQRHVVDVLVISYEHAALWQKEIEGDIFDFLICDEAHFLKTKGAKRTTAILGYDCDGRKGIGRWARYTWFLTGTPGSNDVSDPWSQLRFCKATPLTQSTFRDRYFRKKVGIHSTTYELRDEMLAEYRNVIRSCFIRRTQREVLPQLPPIWAQTTVIDGDTREIRDLLRQHPGLEDAIVQAVEKGGLSFLDAQHIATLRRLVGEAKAPGFTEWLVEELATPGPPVIVFGLHIRALDTVQDGLKRAGIKCVRVDGAVSERDRTAAVERFQAGDTRVFLGQIRAAGTALTLTAAHDVIMMEQDWSPAANAQAIKRVHRIGQNSHVNVRFMQLANSIDENVASVVARKTMQMVKLGVFTPAA